MDLPQEFLVRMENMLGEEYGEFLRSYDEPRRFGLRVNTLKISVDEFVRLAPFHLRRIPWTDNGFYYEREDDPARHPFYYAGLYYLQEPSAMLPAAVLPVAPGDRVLDLCAAPGGKATALAAKLQGRGLLAANEISASRAKALLKNLEVFGVTNAYVTNTTANRLAERFPEVFDRILVDAPCSGEGMFRKDMANARAWSPEKVAACAKLQREITLQAVQMLRPGGLMLYSTCTFSAEENEGTVAHLLHECPDLELLEIPWNEGFAHGSREYLRRIGQDGPEELSRCVRIFPHRCGGEGHFLALLRRRGGDVAARAYEHKGFASRPLREGDTSSAVWPCGAGDSVSRLPGGDAFAARALRGRRGSGKRGGPAPSVRDHRTEEAALAEFLGELREPWRMDRIELRADCAFYVPEPPPEDAGLPFLRSGLYLGEFRRGRFEPSQAFAMAIGQGGYGLTLDFAQDDPRIVRYLRGETLQAEDLPDAHRDGWRLVTVCGYPLGWGKLVRGTLKNKYHPGWRMQA